MWEQGTNGKLYYVFFFPKKKPKRTSICQSPIEACHCTVHGELHYAISSYGIKKNTQSETQEAVNSSRKPVSNGGKKPVEETASVFQCRLEANFKAPSRHAFNDGAFISHWLWRTGPYTKVISDLPPSTSVSPSSSKLI